ncbi:MAG: hypothetical protein E6Q76_05355 [Rhizobium sp.]|nr:MAG: hypothetical protein E6Q76_05355 [Rhizobium sp.]
MSSSIDTPSDFAAIFQKFAPLLPQVLERMTTPVNSEQIGQLRRNMNLSGGLNELCSVYFQMIDQTPVTAWEQSIDDYLHRQQESGWEFNTTLPSADQRKFATLTWRELYKSGRRALLRTFVLNAWYSQMCGFASAPINESASSSQVGSRIFQYLVDLGEADSLRGRRLLGEMMQQTMPKGFNALRGGEQDDWESTYFTRIMGNLSIELFGLLLGLPYAEMMADPSGAWLPTLQPFQRPAKGPTATTGQVDIPRSPAGVRAKAANGYLQLDIPTLGSVLATKVRMPATVREDNGDAAYPIAIVWFQPGSNLVAAMILYVPSTAPTANQIHWPGSGVSETARRAIVGSLAELHALAPSSPEDINHPALRKFIESMVSMAPGQRNVRDAVDDDGGSEGIAPQDAIPNLPDRPFPLRLAATPNLGPYLRALIHRAVDLHLQPSDNFIHILERLGLNQSRMPLMDLESSLRFLQRGNDVRDYVLYKIAGGQTYQFPSHLGAELIESDASDVPFAELRLPHTGFYLHIGSSMRLECRTSKEKNATVDIEGFFIGQGSSHSGQPAYSISPILDPASRTKGYVSTALQLPFGPGTVAEQITLGCQEAEAALVKMQQQAHALMNNPKQAQLQKQLGVDLNAMLAAQEARQLVFTGDAAIKICSAVAAMLCYITAYPDTAADSYAGANPETLKTFQHATEKRKQRILQNWEASGISRVHLFKDPFESGSSKPQGDIGVKAAHVRRGHWRMQVHGAGRALRKLIWLHPQLINAAHPAQTRDRVYEVEGD